MYGGLVTSGMQQKRLYPGREGTASFLLAD